MRTFPEYGRPVSGPDGLLRWLGQAARDARVRSQRTQSQVAAEIGVNRETISRFEAGKHWPRDPDLLMRAYAMDLDVDVRDLWEEALRRWSEAR